MDDTCATLFSWLDTDSCQDEVLISLTSARSDCAGVVLRGAQQASSPRRSTNAVCVSHSSDRLNDTRRNLTGNKTSA